MENHCFYLSTISADAADTARRYGLGLEIAEFCTACNMDERFSEMDAAVREKLAGIGRVTLHAPSSEPLFTKECRYPEYDLCSLSEYAKEL